MRSIAVLLVVAACGSSSPATPDAGAPDGAADNITAIVYDRATPTRLAGVPVVFVEADGSIAAEKTTDANGTATASIHAGASVTALYPAYDILRTVRDVAPGDTIVIGASTGPGMPIGQFTANVPTYPGAAAYDVFGPCLGGHTDAAPSGAPTAVTFVIDDDCKPTTMDLVAFAVDGSDVALAWSEQQDVPYTSDGQATMPSTWQPLQTLSLAYAHAAAADVLTVDVTVYSPDGRGRQVQGFMNDTTDPQTGSFQVAPLAKAMIKSDVMNKDGSAFQSVYDVVDGTRPTYALDLSTALLPFVRKPTLDPATGVVSIPGATAGSALFFQLQYVGAGHSVTWEVFTPPATAVTLPQLPADLAQLYPAAGDVLQLSESRLFGGDRISDWSQLRGHADDVFGAYQLGLAGPGRYIESYPVP